MLLGTLAVILDEILAAFVDFDFLSPFSGGLLRPLGPPTLKSSISSPKTEFTFLQRVPPDWIFTGFSEEFQFSIWLA